MDVGRFRPRPRKNPAAASWVHCRIFQDVSCDVNSGWINHGLWQLWGYPPNSHKIIHQWGIPIIQSRGLLIQGWHYRIDFDLTHIPIIWMFFIDTGLKITVHWSTSRVSRGRAWPDSTRIPRAKVVAKVVWDQWEVLRGKFVQIRTCRVFGFLFSARLGNPIV